MPQGTGSGTIEMDGFGNVVSSRDLAIRRKPISTKYATGPQLRELWRGREKAMPNSRKRIRFCRDVQRGKTGIRLPRTYGNKELREVLVVSHPMKKTYPIRMTATLASRRCYVKRNSLGENMGAKKAATDLESWDNGFVEQTFPWLRCVGLSVQQSEFGLYVLPTPATWEDQPDWTDAVTLEEYEGMDEDERAAYKPNDTEDVTKGFQGYETRENSEGQQEEAKRPNPRYWRDNADNVIDPKDRRKRKRNEGKTRNAFEEELKAFLAQRLPFVVRAESALNCLPILARGRAKDPFMTVGLIVKSLYEEEDLLRMKYRWGGKLAKYQEGNNETGNGLGPAMLHKPIETLERQGTSIVCYEAFLLDPETGNPYYVFSVSGMETAQEIDGEEEATIVDLYEEYGITNLPAKYLWANQLEDDDPDERGVPLMDPFATAILNVETFLTHEGVYSRRTAFPGIGVELDPKLPPSAFLDEKGQLKQFSIPQDGGVVLLPGKAQPMMAPRVGDSAHYFTQALLGEMEQQRPKTPGETPGSSGHQDVIQDSYFAVSQTMIMDCLSEAVAFVATTANEYAWCASKGKWKCLGGKRVDIPIYVNTEIAPGGDTDAPPGEEQTRILEFKERWIGPRMFQVHAEYIKVGNIAEVEQEASLYERGLAEFDDVQTKRGKTSPEVVRANIAADKWLNSEAGQLYITQQFAAWRGDVEEAELARLQFQGLVSMGDPAQGVQPMPTAALAQDPGAAGGGPTTAAAQRAGIISGARNTGPARNDAMAASAIAPQGGFGQGS